MTAREIQALLRELAELLVKNCEAVERAGRMRKAGIAASRRASSRQMIGRRALFASAVKNIGVGQ